MDLYLLLVAMSSYLHLLKSQNQIIQSNFIFCLDCNDFFKVATDLAILVTDHGKFEVQKIVDAFPLILDTRFALRVEGNGKIFRL